jgi:hypothetical protein
MSSPVLPLDSPGFIGWARIGSTLLTADGTDEMQEWEWDLSVFIRVIRGKNLLCIVHAALGRQTGTGVKQGRG